MPPIAPARPHPVVSPHGVRDDPYYWLRDDTRSDPEVIGYLKAENDYADRVLAPTRPLQEQIYQEIIGRIRQDDSSVPYLKRGYWYYRRYETGREYPIFARRATLQAPEQIMLDVNRMAEGYEFFQVGTWAVSPDNRLLAWAQDDVGRRQYTIRIKDLDTGVILPDAILNAEPAIAWTADSRSLLYVAKDPVTLLGNRVHRHALGDDPLEDPLLYEQTDKAFYTGIGVTKDERYLLIESHSTMSTEVQAALADDPLLRFEVLIPRERDHEYQAEHLNGRWILRTNWKAKNFRIVEADIATLRDRTSWRDLVAHRGDAYVEQFDVFADFLAVEERSGGLSNVRIRPWHAGAPSFPIEAEEPAYTLALGANAELDTPLVRYTYTSLITPPSTYDFDTVTGAKTLLKREAVYGGYDRERYATEHVWATARDGTQVPVSLAYRKDLRLTGGGPLLQYGYGAYGLSMDPAFSYSVVSLLDRGFVYAIAHIRGGQEMGRAWYENGRLLNKQNTFTDFIDVTRHLVAQGYADRRRVFAMGGSAGGTLMGAVANQAPQEYRGIVAQVPFVDVVTTMLDESIPLTTNEFDEWGNPQERRFHDYMLSYSPYDNVQRQKYPAMFVGTGLWDSQVQYFEPAKWVAKLRAMKTDDNPLLFRIHMEAGHGGKSGRFQRFREIAEQYAFIVDQASQAS